MCGICGIYSFQKPLVEAAAAMEQALPTLRNRGPEVQASHCQGRIALGHTRLSIIDTSVAANQPFKDETGRYVLVFNGEIYNYQSLRHILQAKGVSFRTHSDTEVLLNWLIHKGAPGISDLQGFFAFAFYDTLKDHLLLARDRLGKKPLLYYQNQDKLVFASEMKALAKLGIPRNLDYTSLQIYFQLNYIPAPWSIYHEVKKLMPGHYLSVEAGQSVIRQYYAISHSSIPQYQRIDYDAAMVLLREKLENAVVKRLVADVPLGAFLSGGIDSSVVVALAARHKKHLQTFSIGFRDEPMFDETAYARSVARMHKTEHTEFSLTNNDLLDCLYDVLDYTDEPFADSSALAVYILSRETRSRVTVALSGDGADEMLGGYNKHFAHWKAARGGVAARALQYLAPLLKHMPQSRNSFLSNKIRQLHRFGEGMRLTHKDRYWRWAAFTDEQYPQKLLLHPPDLQQYYHRKKELTAFVSQQNDMNGVWKNDMHLVLPNDMLTKVDMMSMANSLEVRVPFLDHDLVDFVFSLPEHYKITQSQQKRILRDAFRDMLPPELYSRPKQGFEVPLLSWFRKELKDTIVHNWLNEEYIIEQGIFDPKVMNNLKKKLFSSNPGEIHAQLWSIAVFQHWYKKNHD